MPRRSPCRASGCRASPPVRPRPRGAEPPAAGDRGEPRAGGRGRLPPGPPASAAAFAPEPAVISAAALVLGVVAFSTRREGAELDRERRDRAARGVGLPARVDARGALRARCSPMPEAGPLAAPRPPANGGARPPAAGRGRPATPAPSGPSTHEPARPGPRLRRPLGGRRAPGHRSERRREGGVRRAAPRDPPAAPGARHRLRGGVTPRSGARGPDRRAGPDAGPPRHLPVRAGRLGSREDRHPMRTRPTASGPTAPGGPSPRRGAPAAPAAPSRGLHARRLRPQPRPGQGGIPIGRRSEGAGIHGVAGPSRNRPRTCTTSPIRVRLTERSRPWTSALQDRGPGT